MSNLQIAIWAFLCFCSFFAGYRFGWHDRDLRPAAKINEDGVLIIAGSIEGVERAWRR